MSWQNSVDMHINICIPGVRWNCNSLSQQAQSIKADMDYIYGNQIDAFVREDE